MAAVLANASVVSVADAEDRLEWWTTHGEGGRVAPEDWTRWAWSDTWSHAGWSPVAGYTGPAGDSCPVPDGEPAEHGYQVHGPVQPVGSLAVRSVALAGADGVERLVRLSGRHLRSDWLADPAREGRRVARCCSGSVALRWSSGRTSSAPVECGSRVCPERARVDGARQVAELVDPVAELVASGHQVVLLTLTQRAYPAGDRPVVLTPWEIRAGYVADEVADVGYPVAGEDLAGALDRLTETWRAMVNRDRAAAAAWSAHVAGGVYRWEVTGFERRADGRHPRWHAHLHVVLVLRPGAEVEHVRWCRRCDRSEAACRCRVEDPDRWHVRAVGPWLDSIRAQWCRLSGAEPQCQVAVPVGGDPEQVRSALREVLKYPFKAAELTDAQLVEALACLKGRHQGFAFGALHGSSRVGRAAAAAFELLSDVESWEPDQVAELARPVLGELSTADRSAALALARGRWLASRAERPNMLLRPETPEDTGQARQPGWCVLQVVTGSGGVQVTRWWRPVTPAWLAAVVLREGPDVSAWCTVRSPDGIGLDPPWTFRPFQTLLEMAEWTPGPDVPAALDDPESG